VGAICNRELPNRSNKLSFIEELKRRNVFRVGVAYIVASWVMLQVADLVLEAISAPDWVLLTLMLVVGLGFVAALIIAWAYEMTPEGIKREQDVERSESVTNETAARLNRLTIGLVIAAVAIVAIDRMIPEKQLGSENHLSAQTEASTEGGPLSENGSLTPITAVSDEPSIAVLPFVNMSSDPEQEFFSDGISEEILNALTKIPNLKVAARTSSFQFKGQNLDIADIARQLRVNHVLEGSVRKAGLQLRITAQLIEARTGYHMWSETFDRKLEDVFAIQDEIAGAIAAELRTRLSKEPMRASKAVNMDAYELYLKGLGLVATRKEEDLFTAFGVLKAALEIEPDYVAAMATLARGYVVAPWFTNRVPVTELREQGRFWANKALQIEPDNAEALSSLAIVVNEQDMDSDKALQLLRQAVQANPGHLAVNNFLGDVLFRTGDLANAVVYESKAAELDPLAPVHLSDLAFVYLITGDYDKVLDLSERGLKQNPAFSNSHQGMREAYWARGDLEKLEQATTAQIESGVYSESFEVLLSARLDLTKGNTAEAKNKLMIMYERAKRDEIGPIIVAFEAVAHGEFDIAGEMLLKAYANQIGNWTFPLYVRLPEQAPDSAPWQEFWSLPEPAHLAKVRRANGMPVHYPAFGEAAPR